MKWETYDQWMLLVVVTLGAILMYLYNALTAPRRRAWLLTQVSKSIDRGSRVLVTMWRDACNQARDLWSEVKKIAY
jgi:hypothetical protein